MFQIKSESDIKRAARSIDYKDVNLNSFF